MFALENRNKISQIITEDLLLTAYCFPSFLFYALVVKFACYAAYCSL
jgi:hypothetical protein